MQDVYKVEAILGRKKFGQTTKYLDKWTDYKLSESNWEPAQGLPQSLVAEYETQDIPVSARLIYSTTLLEKLVKTESQKLDPEEPNSNPNFKICDICRVHVFDSPEEKEKHANGRAHKRALKIKE